jgi:hypothetical protein
VAHEVELDAKAGVRPGLPIRACLINLNIRLVYPPNRSFDATEKANQD